MPAYAHRLATAAPRRFQSESPAGRPPAAVPRTLQAVSRDGGTSGLQARVETAARFGHNFEGFSIHSRPSSAFVPSLGASRSGEAPAAHGPAAHGPAPSNVVPIQRELGRKAFQRGTTGLAGPVRNQVHAAIRNYNRGHDASDNSEAHLHQQLAALDAVEHHLYGLSHQVDFTNAAAGPRRSATAVSDLLNEVQAEHRSLIDRTVRHQRQLWVHGAVNPTERDSVNATWNSLVAGNGSFRVSDETNDLGGRVRIPQGARDDLHGEILAHSARLLSRPAGRRLLHGLRERSSDSSWAAHAVGLGTHNREVGFEASNLYTLQGGGAGSLNYKAYDGGGDEANPRDTAHGLVAGQGERSLVKVSPGIKDATLLDQDAAGRRVVSPSFVGFGHELIHAGRYQRGAYVQGQYPAAGLPAGYNDDLEEFHTIADAGQRPAVAGNAFTPTVRGQATAAPTTVGHVAGLGGNLPTEAEIRAEHGLEIRSGHGAPIANPAKFAGGINTVADSQNWEAHHVGGNATPVVPPVSYLTQIGRAARRLRFW